MHSAHRQQLRWRRR